ncbi:MAG TPA: hypothetical protein VGJ13_21590 [Pseudonocardiaceae bacterium]|jgi:hypothetical protein
MPLILALALVSIFFIMLGIIVKSLMWLVILGAVLLLVTFGFVAVTGRTS